MNNNATATAHHQCEVYTFVSSKGGTGKTLIAASFAYLLRSCGWRVVLVDTDFATRGLSLYILGTSIESEEISLEPENCIAESILLGTHPSAIHPRTIVRDGTTYDVVFANSDVYEGGAPEERLLGLGEEPLEGSAYRAFFSGLVEHLRKNYDYVVIDTRGGIDGSSVVPAIESDGFVVVMEADQLSLGQVHGLLTKINQYSHAKSGGLRGFIVNKGVFSPTAVQNNPESLNVAS
jgi:flagellar biosynthesis protein FlhG